MCDDLFELNGKTITLGQLIDFINKTICNNSKVYVPMYQRNYKWNKDRAIQLIDDLLKTFQYGKQKSISLFTLYINKDKNIQIVDGQQRIITLLLLFKAMDKISAFIPLEFERDFSLELENQRKYFIDDLSKDIDKKLSIACTDKRRLYYNYRHICDVLTEYNLDNELFINYLRENVKLLLHITQDEPVSEFLNLNCNKTKFSICDRIRSALITYSVFNHEIPLGNKKLIAESIECSDYKKGISTLFDELTMLLYHKDIYETIKLGYVDPDETKENRINIMFKSFVYSPDKNGYMFCKSLDEMNVVNLLIKLSFYKSILTELKNDFDKGNYITSEAYKNFHMNCSKSILFFDLLDKYVDKKSESHTLSGILHAEHSIDKLIMAYIKDDLKGADMYFVNSYFEILSENRKRTSYSTILKKAYIEKSNNKYFPLNEKHFEDIVQGSGKYILYRYSEDQQKENDNMIYVPPIVDLTEVPTIVVETVNDSDKIATKVTVNELLLNGNRKIIMPVIQRDYCMGNHFGNDDKKDMLHYLLESFQNNKDVILSAITVLQANKRDIYIYDGQQRIITLAFIISMLKSKNKSGLNEIVFEHREKFNNFCHMSFKNVTSKEMSASYSEAAVQNLKKILHDRIQNIEEDKFKEYILDKVSLDVVTVEGALSTAEQFFIEINDGVQLVPYEIFKCKINDRYKSLVEARNSEENIKGYKEWIAFIDNEWLDGFYKFNNTEIESETSKEEIMEMRFIEFCCRMLYWEKYIIDKKDSRHPLQLKGFFNNINASDIGDSDLFLKDLDLDDFKRIKSIMNSLLDIINSNDLDTQEQSIIFDGEIFNNLNGHEHYIIPYYKEEYSKKHRNYYLKEFILKLDNDSYQKDRRADLVMWGILNYLSVNADESIAAMQKILKKLNNTVIYNKRFAYITAFSAGKYAKAILPMPKYYYDFNKYVDIYNMLPLPEKPKDEILHELYNSIMDCFIMKNINKDNIGTESGTVDREKYAVYYRYRGKKTAFAMLAEKVEITSKKKVYLVSNNGYYFFEIQDTFNLKKDIFQGVIRCTNGSTRFYYYYYTFAGTDEQFYREI